MRGPFATDVASRIRVRAPELRARGGWINTGGRSLSLNDLRGKIVLLDFWTFCCANCLHVLDELRPLEERFGDVLVVVGVHSPKFAHEAEHDAVLAAVDRYEVHHAVLDDPDLALWRQYAVRAWPTLVLIDPEGYVVAQAAGEGQADSLAMLIEQLVAEFEPRGLLRRGEAPYVPPDVDDVALRFPAKAIVIPADRPGGGNLLVADAGHHSLVELSLDLGTVLRRIGSGARSSADGPADVARFAEPNGLALLPGELAASLGYDVLVADTANHVLRGVRLADGALVATVDLPDLLRGRSTITGAIPSVLSPWDVAWWPAIERVVIAAAGVHLLLTWDPLTNSADVLAGTTVEGLRDGAALDAWLAQPSGLAVDGDRLWFVDSETSALRYLTAEGAVHTVVGEGLFDFGHVDGPAATARLQHPLGVAVFDGGVIVADTYNGAVRRVDPVAGTVSTLGRGLAEPSGLAVVDGQLVVVESAAHRLTQLATAASVVDGPGLRTERPAIDVAPGPVELFVRFEPPAGRKLDERDGPATRLSVTASGLSADGVGDGTDLRRSLRLDGESGVLHVTAQAASCDDDPAIEHPACHLARQDWGVPIRLVAGGTTRIELTLLG